MRPSAIAAAAIVATLSIAVPSWSTSSSSAPYGSHLLEEPPRRSHRALAHHALIKGLRQLADAIDAYEPIAVGSSLLLTPLSNVEVHRLDRDSRIVLQHAALRIASSLSSRRWGETPATLLEIRATALARQLALPRATLAVMSQAPLFAAQDWLGSQGSWIERSTSFCGGNGPLVHERKFKGMLAFHPIRSGDRRALISQLVAVDDEGNPHITPIVEAIELRVGMGDNAPVAVLELDIGSLGNGHAALTAPPLQDVHESYFVRKDNAGGFTCGGCHGTATAFDARDIVDPLEASALVASRKNNLLELARRRLAGLEL